MSAPSSESFRDLMVWRKAHQFVLAVYNYSDYFPQKEVSGLTSQLRRAAISIPASLAEGFGKQSATDQSHLLKTAQGAIAECRYYLILAKDLGYGDHPELMPQLEEVGELLKEYAAARLASGL